MTFATLLALPLAACNSSGIDETLKTSSIDNSASSHNGQQAFAANDLTNPYHQSQNILEQQAEARIPLIEPDIKDSQCPGGWSKKPAKLDALRYTPGDPYYIEMRMRQTPPLPVGHTYIAFGRLDPNGKKLDERLIMLAPAGGYVGAGLASAVPMPGKLTPTHMDCTIPATASYRVSITATKYEKLLLAAKKARKDKPLYMLFAFNCNHFASMIAASTGIRPPKNRYTAALSYIYGVIEENEGTTRLAKR